MTKCIAKVFGQLMNMASKRKNQLDAIAESRSTSISSI